MFKLEMNFDTPEHKKQYFEYITEILEDLVEGTTIPMTYDENSSEGKNDFKLAFFDCRPLIAFKNRSPRYPGLIGISFEMDSNKENSGLRFDIETLISKFMNCKGVEVVQSIKTDIELPKTDNPKDKKKYPKNIETYDRIDITFNPEDMIDIDIDFIGSGKTTVTTTEYVFTSIFNS